MPNNRREVSFSRSPPDDVRSVPSPSSSDSSSNDDDDHGDDERIGQEEEATIFWYTQSEYDRILREIADTVRAYRRQRRASGRDDYYQDLDDLLFLRLRGIEHLLTSRRVLRAREEERAAVVRAVLDEQSRQRRAVGGGVVFDLWAIRAVSVSASRVARIRALESARGDEEAAPSSSSVQHVLLRGREAAGRDSLLRLLDRASIQLPPDDDTNAANETMMQTTAVMPGTDEEEGGRSAGGSEEFQLLQVLSRALALSGNDTRSDRST